MKPARKSVRKAPNTPATATWTLAATDAMGKYARQAAFPHVRVAGTGANRHGHIPMTIHIGARPGEIAGTVLLPGDPYRAKWAAGNFLEDVQLVNEVRGMLGFTGVYKGNRVTIHGSGMGMPSLSIYVNELIRDYGVQTLIRIGSCGGMQERVRLRDVILAMTSSTVSTPSRGMFRELNFAPCADFDLLRAAADVAAARGVRFHVGGIYSSDTFYDERPDLNELMVRHDILGVEMEAAELYTLAARHGCRALAVLAVSDHLGTGEALPSEERERGFGDMVGIALEAAFSSPDESPDVPSKDAAAETRR